MTSEGGTQYVVLSAKTQAKLDEMIRQAEADGWQTMPGAYDSEGIFYQPMKRDKKEAA